MLDAGCLPPARPQRAGSPGHYDFLLPFMSTWFSNRSSDRVTQRTSMLESTRELLICFRNTWNWSGARAQTGGGRLPPCTAMAQGGHLWPGALIYPGPDASGQTEARTSWVSCPSAAAHATSDTKPSVLCTDGSCIPLIFTSTSLSCVSVKQPMRLKHRAQSCPSGARAGTHRTTSGPCHSHLLPPSPSSCANHPFTPRV